MSHFTVTVRLTAERLARHEGDVESALTEMLLPFDENSEDRRFVEFEDVEDEYREKYATGTSERVKMWCGELVQPWDERFRVPGQFGIGGGSHKVPDGLDRVQVPHSVDYPTFAKFCEEYAGYKRDPEKGRFGYWRNPNKKWDWWKIGGRWTGFFPLKAGVRPRLGSPGAFGTPAENSHGDIVRKSEIDFDQAMASSVERSTKFWGEWQRFLEGEKFDAFDGPRSKAIDIGLLDVVRETVAVTAPGTRNFSWETFVRDAQDERRAWTDVAKLVTQDEFFREYGCYFDTLVTYAGLDDAGWSQPGRMGWFASTDATPATRLEHVKTFRSRFIDPCGPEDLLVAVDCHI